jgi:hypothetical protein
MRWKRLLVSIFLGFLVMVGDGILLMAVHRLYVPRHAPAWMTAAIFYVDAWPVLITQHIFRRAPGDTYGGPTFLAVVAGALIDLILLTLIIYGLLSWRARRKAARS